MGYNVNMRGSNFTIPAENVEAACQAMKALNHSDTASKGGGTYYRGGRTKHFSWMHENYDQLLNTAEEIFVELGFEVEMGVETEKGGTADLTLMGYDSKIGDEEQFLAAVAPFVPAGSYVNWEGEDGEYWQHYFDGTSMTVKQGEVVYG